MYRGERPHPLLEQHTSQTAGRRPAAPPCRGAQRGAPAAAAAAEAAGGAPAASPATAAAAGGAAALFRSRTGEGGARPRPRPPHGDAPPQAPPIPGPAERAGGGGVCVCRRPVTRGGEGRCARGSAALRCRLPPSPPPPLSARAQEAGRRGGDRPCAVTASRGDVPRSRLPPTSRVSAEGEAELSVGSRSSGGGRRRLTPDGTLPAPSPGPARSRRGAGRSGGTLPAPPPGRAASSAPASVPPVTLPAVPPRGQAPGPFPPSSGGGWAPLRKPGRSLRAACPAGPAPAAAAVAGQRGGGPSRPPGLRRDTGRCRQGGRGRLRERPGGPQPRGCACVWRVGGGGRARRCGGRLGQRRRPGRGRAPAAAPGAAGGSVPVCRWRRCAAAAAQLLEVPGGRDAVVVCVTAAES